MTKITILLRLRNKKMHISLKPMKSRHSKTEAYMYQIRIGYRYSTYICIHEVSKSIILILKNYFIGYSTKTQGYL